MDPSSGSKRFAIGSTFVRTSAGTCARTLPPAKLAAQRVDDRAERATSIGGDRAAARHARYPADALAAGG